MMTGAAERTLLRVHLSNRASVHGRPVYEQLVERALRGHLAGATVLKGVAGFVGKGPLLQEHPGSLGSEIPVVVELVDEEEKLQRFLDEVAPLLPAGAAIVTMERAEVRLPGPAAPGARA
jgi:PII-like signaling protein